MHSLIAANSNPPRASLPSLEAFQMYLQRHSSGKFVFDLHMHLSGSFSLGFLESCSQRNGKMSSYSKFLELREAYGLTPGNLRLLWQQFDCINQIICTPSDVYEGTLDVIASSEADYLEIRTTPKALGNFNQKDYIDAFVKGLKQWDEIPPYIKKARGLLSIDRTSFSEAEALEMIRYVVEEKATTGLLVGVDIGGSPVAKRQITGEVLLRVITHALSASIAIAIHVGEADTEQDSRDTDVVLNTLETWVRAQQDTGDPSSNLLQGRVRLGHAIFLSKSQKERIRKLNLPIEVCPACHERLKWAGKDQPHPVTEIYPLLSENYLPPIISGTDDSLLFLAGAHEECSRVFNLIGGDERTNQLKWRWSQVQFCFEETIQKFSYEPRLPASYSDSPLVQTIFPSAESELLSSVTDVSQPISPTYTRK